MGCAILLRCPGRLPDGSPCDNVLGRRDPDGVWYLHHRRRQYRVVGALLGVVCEDCGTDTAVEPRLAVVA